MKSKYTLLLCIFHFLTTFLCSSLNAQTAKIDSLQKVLKTLEADTNKANILYEISRAYLFDLNDIQKVKEYAQQELELSKKIHYEKGIAYSLLNMGTFYWKTGEYDVALYHYRESLKKMIHMGNKKGESACYVNIGNIYSLQGKSNEATQFIMKSIKIKEELNDKRGISIGYNNLGSLYATVGNYKQALNCFFKTLKIAEESKDKLAESSSYNNIGLIFFHQNKLDIALFYYKKAVKIQEEIGDKVTAGTSYNSIGNIYQAKKQYKEALAYHFRDLKIKETANDKQGISIACNSIGTDYFGSGNFDDALTYQLKSYNVSKKIGYKNGIVDAAGGIGKLYEEKKQYEKALLYYDHMHIISCEIEFKEGIRDAYANKASVYTKLRQFEKALDFTNLYNEVKDTLLNKNNFKQIAELNTRYETDKKEKEILLLIKDQQLNAKIIKQQQYMRWGLIGGVLLLLISIVSIYKKYRFKQKANIVLEEQKEEIEQKNTLIIDSIDYAKTIQDAILPTTQKVRLFFPESFILFKPKAIVSGDFYWLNSIHGRLICAVGDCNGHGVPGAFMSLLGYNMLENVIKKKSITKPAFILNEVNAEIIYRLSYEHKKVTVEHGMNIALIFIDKDNGQLQFSGAHNPLYIVRNNELIELKADKISIGFIKEYENGFSNQNFQLIKGDMIYLFTNGFPDQIGGPEHKSFSYGSFKDLLTAISPLDTYMQMIRLEESYISWCSEGVQQTDDILIIGIRY